MLKLKILTVGKTKEKWLDEAISLYQKRMQGTLLIECSFAKDAAQLIELAQKEPQAICLDPAGVLFTSEEFSRFLMKEWALQGSRLTIVIGGAEGLPAALKEGRRLLSLSPLTFTHQMTRLLLIEQVYRALEIERGSPYHK